MAEAFAKKFSPPQGAIEKLLASHEQSDVAMGLANLLAESQPDLQGQIRSLGHIIWQKYNLEKNDDFKKAEDKKRDAAAAVKALFETVGAPQQKLKLTEAYARLGHLYEIAGHVARVNFFKTRDNECVDAVAAMGDKNPDDKILERNQVVPGGLNEMLFMKDKDGKANPFAKMKLPTVIDKLNTPVSEYVFTQHPTNTNQLGSMKLQRQIAQDAGRVVGSKGDIQKLQTLKDSIKQFADTPLVSKDNFTAKDETGICLNFLENAYHDLDRLYTVTDRALERKFGKEYNDDKRQELDLKVRFGSWGSAGDKDGNNNIKSENTLEAIVMHKQKAAELLLESLREGGNIWPAGLAIWARKLEKAAGEYKVLFDKIEQVRGNGNDIALTNQQFTDFSDEAKKISAMLGKAEDFRTEMDEAIKTVTGEQKTKLLAIDRKLRVFGFNLGKIEYRETAEEYERVVGYLARHVKGREDLSGDFKSWAKQYQATYDAYDTLKKKKEADLTDEDKKAINGCKQEFGTRISEMLGDEKLRAEFIKHSHLTLDAMEGDKLRDIGNKDNAEAITYHSLRRMELARDFGDMITHNVLAEANGVDSLMEALALQFAVTNDAGERAKLHIVPLFEEADTMARIPNVIESSLANPVYHKHMETMLAEDRKKDPTITTKLTQQIQIAHSDNARRAGAIGSRGIIHQGHAAARIAMQNYNEGKSPEQQVNLQFFEGGSLSDSYRNGVRAHTAMMEDFGLDDFAKFTFQGGDLLNYFNQPTSTERVLMRGIVKQVEMIESKQADGVQGTASDLDPVEQAVRGALKELQHGYDEFYDKGQNSSNPIGRLLHALSYRALEKAGNAGTRANRNAKTPPGEDNSGIDSGKLRTIAFSMGFQHNALHPACLGITQLATRLAEHIGNIDGAKEDFQTRFDAFKISNAAAFEKLAEWEKPSFVRINSDAVPFTDKGRLTPEAIHYLYKEGSKAFKDAIDKMAYSLYNTDIMLVKETLEKYQKNNGEDPTLAPVFETIVQYYTHAAHIVHNALSAKECQLYRTNDKPEKLARAIYDIQNLPAMAHHNSLNYKQRFVEGVRAVASAVQSSLDNLVEGGKEYVDRLFYNTRATLYHGRNIMADDPTFRASYMAANGNKSHNAGKSVV